MSRGGLRRSALRHETLTAVRDGKVVCHTDRHGHRLLAIHGPHSTSNDHGAVVWLVKANGLWTYGHKRVPGVEALWLTALGESYLEEWDHKHGPLAGRAAA